MKTIQIGSFTIHENGKPFIIAEAGVNHNGDVETAKQLIRAAKSCSADCVKFQTFRAEQVAGIHAPKAEYQRQTTDPGQSQYEMLKELELGYSDFEQLMLTCEEEGILFLSTPYSESDADLLERLGVSAYKIASGQAVEPLFLEYLAQKKKPLILSTGMCTLEEVDEAVHTIHQTGNENIILLQCTTNYPAQTKDANLRAMHTLKQAFGLPVGYSDHTPSLTAAVAAAALGASVIERHFTLDQTMPGPDHFASSEPDEFKTLVQMVHEAWSCLGSGDKQPVQDEIDNIPRIRRGLVCRRAMKAGEFFSRATVTAKRPLSGIEAKHIGRILGKQAVRDLPQDHPIQMDDVQ